MYITYETKQWCMTTPYQHSGPYTQPPRKFSILPKPDFMPTWLVRISDMQVVRGSTVNEGYCALSYSWNHSGDSIVDEVTGKSQRVDEGKHKIIFPGKKVPRKPRGRKRIPSKTKHVLFESVIQQICKDFNIKYIWYDQWCINQGNKEEKHREIRLMHRVYSCAHCAVVLLPEFQSYSSPGGDIDVDLRAIDSHYLINTSQWLTRLWTLEEALLSQRLLFVGRNVHLWWFAARDHLDISFFCRGGDRAPKKVSTILEYAHQRSSTNDHDRVFALANLFPDIIHCMANATYEQPCLDLIVQFYGLLAEKDLSILCFGDASLLDQDRPIQKFEIPSWTGVHGKHYLEHVVDGQLYPSTSFQNYKIMGRFMQVTCTYISTDSSTLMTTTIAQRQMQQPSGTMAARTLASKDLPPPSTFIRSTTAANSEDAMDRWILAISARLPGHKSSKTVILDEIYGDDPYEDFVPTKQAETLLQFIPVEEKESLFWADDISSQQCTRFEFDLTEDIDASEQYIILSGISFDHGSPGWKFSPVIKKEQDYYKAIGVCHIENPDYFFSDYIVPEDTFMIE